VELGDETSRLIVTRRDARRPEAGDLPGDGLGKLKALAASIRSRVDFWLCGFRRGGRGLAFFVHIEAT
jgi:hypothetical protein